jgi:hypothetical protein
MEDIYVVLKDNTALYYLMKIVRSGFDVYCIPPHLCIHYSLHETGESHFQFEETAKPEKQPPLMLIMNEAGTPIGKGIMRASLTNLGRAVGICGAILSIDSLSEDFSKFNRNVAECFVIDKTLFSKDASYLEIGIWAVPARNQFSFEWNNKNIPANLLYKVADCEPQIWIYARPFP